MRASSMGRGVAVVLGPVLLGAWMLAGSEEELLGRLESRNVVASEAEVVVAMEASMSVPSALTTFSPHARPSTHHQSLALCPSWSVAVASHMQKRCQVYFELAQEWISRSVKGYGGFGRINIGGQGDRLASLATGFHLAMNESRRFRVTDWPGLSSHFEPCAFAFTDHLQWNKTVREKHNPTCLPYIQHSCRNLFGASNSSCLEGGTRFVAPNRLCHNEALCTRLKQNLGDLTIADTFGCPLRLLMEPKRRFMDEVRFNFRTGKNVESMSLRQIVERISKYFVIAVHSRLGDDNFRSAQQKPLDDTAQQVWQNVFRCAKTVEWYRGHPNEPPKMHRASRGWNATRAEFLKPVRVDGKEVRYLVLSDSSLMRNQAVEVLGDNILMFEIRPEHNELLRVPNEQARREAEDNLWAEWYVIGLADEGVFSDRYHNRVSAFTVTSLAYHFKNRWHSSTTCKVLALPDSGFLDRRENHPKCSVSQKAFAQPHLDALKNYSNFPSSWVLHGVVIHNEIQVPWGRLSHFG